jgi:hypothetical protein
VVPPQPASAAAIARATAALAQRNRIFKIPYLDAESGTSRFMNKFDGDRLSITRRARGSAIEKRRGLKPVSNQRMTPEV